MNSTRKIRVILFMAMSVNGIIAQNGDEDFLSDEHWISFMELAKEAGFVIWGRKTWEVVRSWDSRYLDMIKGVKKVIVSSDEGYDSGEGFIAATSPQIALDKLKSAGCEKVILAGGASLNSAFAKDQLIDEVYLNIEPVLIGEGTTLFYPSDLNLNLVLSETKLLAKGIFQIHYQVQHKVL